MADEVGAAYMPILPSTDGFGSKLERDVSGDLARIGGTGGTTYGRQFSDHAGRTLGSRARSMFRGLLTVGAVSAAAAGVALGKVLVSSVGEAKEAAVVGARTNNVIKRMGASSWISARQVESLAGALSKKAGVDDEAIQSGQNLLLTFGNVRNETGKGNAIFNQTTRLMLDMSVAMKQDASSSAIQLGKALNDPIAGISALSRVGVSFTAQQKEQIKTLVESGKTLQAQKVILGEVGKQFGGAAKAMATPGDRLKVTWGNLEEVLGKGLNPVLNSGARLLNREVLPPIIALAEEYVPKAGREFAKWMKSFDLDQAASDVHDLVDGIDWASFTGTLGDLVKIGRDLGPAFADSAGDGAKVFGTIIGFVADHTDELAKAMPLLVAGLVAYKAAQLANNTVGRNSVIGFGLQTSSTFALAAANRQLAVTMREVNAASATSGAGIAGTTQKLTRMQLAVRGVAGVGGLGLLAHGATQSSDKLGLLESAAGGALTGFALAGPWGAAVGAGAGALVGLATNTDTATAAFKTSIPKIDSMTDSLNQLTGAITTQGQADALANIRKRLQDLIEIDVGESNFGELQEKYGKLVGVLEDIPDGSTIESLARQFGLSGREIAQAAIGQRSAVESVSRAFRKHGHDSYENIVAMRALRNVIGPVNKELRKNRAEVIRNAVATQDWSGKLKKFPTKAATRIDLKGVKPTETAIARLTLKYKNIDNKDIKTILGVTGVEASVKEIRRAAKELDDTDKKTANPNIGIHGAQEARTDIERVRMGIQDLNGERADTYIYHHHVTTYETQGNPPANRQPPVAPRLPTERFPETSPRALTLPGSGERHAGSGNGLHGRRMALVLSDGTQLDAYIDERIDAAADLTAETARALPRG